MIQQLLLAGQVLVVVLLYVFVWRVVRTARMDLARGAATGGGSGGSLAAQESTIMPADEVARARREAGIAEPRIVVLESASLRSGVPYTISHTGLTLGRADDNDLVLDDQTVSSHHLRLVPPSTLVDLGSTNGTLVNGRRVEGRVRLNPGDQVRVGATTFRFEVPR